MNHAATETTTLHGELALEPRERVPDQVAVQPRALVTPTPADLLALAMSKGADLDQLERLMALQERWESNQAEKAFVSAMTAFKAEPIEILKRKRVFFQTQKGSTEYHHAELADVVDAAITGMAKHGLSHRWDINQLDGGWIEVTCVVTHAQGHSKSTSLRSQREDSGTKNAIQSVASAITYLQRYTLLAALGLATKGMDDDGRGGPDNRPASPAKDPGAEAAQDAVVKGLWEAAEKGTKALLAAWGQVPERERQRVGLQFKDIKARAQAVGP